MRWTNGRRNDRSTAVIATAITAILGVGLALAPMQAASAASGTGSVPAAKPTPPALVPPLLTPSDGTYLEGAATIAATPVVADDDVTGLTLDGAALEATPTVGVSHLRFDVGTNSIEARYGNHVLVNGDHRIDLGDHVNERVDLEIPNEHLVHGENSIEIVTGTIETSCGINHDDFVLSNIGLELLGEVADGEENEYSYSFGDGSCGSNTSLRLSATLSFFILGDPQGTTGLTAELDTTTVANGSHMIVATTASGATASSTVTVNNAPGGAPLVTPADGTIVKGVQTVFATQPAALDAGVASLTVDGAATPSVATLGAGDATLSFDVGSNALEARYRNHILVNGMRFDIGDAVNQRTHVVFPNEWLQPGANTIRLVTGGVDAACGVNRDDFAVSALALAPAVGTAAGVGLKSSYSMGDGNCGSSTSALREVALQFTVDAASQSLRADLDTTALADGEHAIAAASVTGEVATRTLVTDNSGPAVVSSVPSAGSTITQAVALDVRLEDFSGVLSGPDVTLDGAPVTLADPIGPGLSAGEHTLAVTAADGLGNGVTHQIVFTSAGIPDAPAELAPASGTEGVDDAVSLEAEVAEPDGGPVTATFSQAEILTPNQVWQGTSPEVPTTLQVEGEQKVAGPDTLLPGDGLTLDTESTRDVAWQRFDVMVQGHVDAPVLRWVGTIDPDRLASLRAWNLTTSTWDVLASARGAAEGDTVLTAGVDDRYLDGRQVHAMVTGEDPFADDLEAGDPSGFADPGSYDFSIAHFTDTQYISEGAVEQETAEERAVWESAYAGIVDWIAGNAEERKIAYVAHTGDVIENNIRVPATEAMQQQVVGEFEVSSRQQAVLDAAGVPNGVVAGNHDNQSGTENGPGAIFNQYYGPDRYAAASAGWEQAEYGGPWREGDNQNHFDLFSAGGLEFVVVGLSYGVTREEAEWADSVFTQFPERNAILLTHDYLQPSTQPDGRDAPLSGADGSMLYNTIVKDNPNVFLILAGHHHGVGTNVKPDVGEIGHGVVELLADYQFYTVSADRLGLTEIGGYQPDDQLQFGASFLRLLQIDVDRGIMNVDTYSPLLDEFGATEYDDRHRYDGTEDDMVLPIDLTSRVTSIHTDSVALYVPTQVVGESTVASGEVASVEWTGLKPGTVYAWIVTARSAGGGESTSEPAVFITTDASGNPGTWDESSPLFPYFGQTGTGER